MQKRTARLGRIGQGVEAGKKVYGTGH